MREALVVSLAQKGKGLRCFPREMAALCGAKVEL
jgi:hypothetical protein